MVNKWLNQVGELTDGFSNENLKAIEFRAVVDQELELVRQAGVRAHDRVSVEMDGSCANLAKVFALWRNGSVVVSCAHHLKDFEREYLQKRAEIDFHWGPNSIQRHTRAATEKTHLSLKKIEGPGLILFTSGTHSLGVPCFFSLDRLNHRIETLHRFIPPSDLAVSLCFMPLQFGHGLIANCLMPLLVGCHVILYPLRDVLAPDALKTIIQKYQISFTTGTSSIWRTLLISNEGLNWGKSIIRVHSASEPLFDSLSHGLMQRFENAKIFNVYGLTEMGSWVSGEDQGVCGKTGGVGSGWGCEIVISQEGEVIVRSQGIMNACRIGEDWKFYDGEEWLNTGDLGVLDSGGGLTVRGRVKNIINRAGVKISIEGLEELLLSHPRINDVCVFSKPNEAVGEEVYAAIATDLSSNELHAWISSRIESSKCPKTYYFCQSIAKTARGKIDRRKVTQEYGKLDGHG
ncbi:MAG: acyl--CoA ligase [Bdellovibrionales bacterium]|nr:acyl--CoA ligase [Bdellovibrionales bacterium]